MAMIPEEEQAFRELGETPRRVKELEKGLAALEECLERIEHRVGDEIRLSKAR
jgi:hypothetical protein